MIQARDSASQDSWLGPQGLRPVAVDPGRKGSHEKGCNARPLAPMADHFLDSEGWPIAPGPRGRLEWRGVESDGERRLYAFTERPKLARKLRAVAGMHPKQIGDREAAVWFRADDTAALASVTRLLKIRWRRSATAPRPAGFAGAHHESENPALEATRSPAGDLQDSVLP